MPGSIYEVMGLSEVGNDSVLAHLLVFPEVVLPVGLVDRSRGLERRSLVYDMGLISSVQGLCPRTQSVNSQEMVTGMAEDTVTYSVLATGRDSSVCVLVELLIVEKDMPSLVILFERRQESLRRICRPSRVANG